MSETVIIRADNQVTIHEEDTTVSVGIPGIQGPIGPQGPAGAAGGSAVIHVQSNPTNVWVVPHDFGREPNVVVVIDNEQVIADITYPDLSTVVISFGENQTGKVVLS